MAQSLFKILKQQDSGTVIDVLAPDWSRPLLERMPEVRHAHVMPLGHGSLALKKRYQVARNLKAYDYTQAIVLPNSWKSALIPWWANIPKRTGFLGECRIGLLNDVRIVNKKKLPRMIDRFAALAYTKRACITGPLPHPCLQIDSAFVETAVAAFDLAADCNRPILALCPGAEFGASKRWPEKHYAQVALAKHKEGWAVWLFGSKHDQRVAECIQAETKGICVDLTGKTTLSQAIDLLSLATVVVTNDSGLMHIAAALQKTLAAIYGSTDPGFTPPLGITSNIVRLGLACSPCFKRECPLGHHQCMQGLSPAKVLDAINSAVRA